MTGAETRCLPTSKDKRKRKRKRKRKKKKKKPDRRKTNDLLRKRCQTVSSWCRIKTNRISQSARHASDLLSAVCYLTGNIETGVKRTGQRYRMPKGGLMLQSIWCIIQKESCTLILIFHRKMPSYLRRATNPACIEVYLTKHGWICVESQEKNRETKTGVIMRIIPCLFFIVMSCTERKKKEKTKHT